MQTVRTFETDNNTYYIGYGKTAKTSYEQQEERKEEFKYMFMQKSVGIIATVLSIIMIYHGAIPALLLTLTGAAVTLTKDHVITI